VTQPSKNVLKNVSIADLFCFCPFHPKNEDLFIDSYFAVEQ